ncbi:MAG: hypothetical protein NC041_07790 [Bacteroides sp.]|nr:hypothetical protein [Prevotella sp.]MCM1407202.1 hypothetical protein [Treponema brennaborense]MCM1470354.1 hypothetical protein [Bacteroides sp.]
MAINANPQDIAQSQQLICRILPLLNQAESYFKSARNWGFLDILGGKTLTNIIKHIKLGNAGAIMNQIQSLLQQLHSTLKTIVIPDDFSMHSAPFATFADFVFDGAIADIYMQSKILTSLDQLQKLRKKLTALQKMLSGC